MDQQIASSQESAVGGSYVSARGILWTAGYMVTLCVALSYCLVALWPRSLGLAITSIKPDHGPVQKENQLQIVGTGLTSGSQVFFGDSAAASVTHKSDSLLEVTTPASGAGPVTVEVDTADGQKTTLPAGFIFGDNQTGVASTTPAAATPQSGPKDPQSKGSGLPLFDWACTLNNNVRLLLIVLLVGALGSLIHILRSFYWYVGNRNLKMSWLLMYFLLPFSGAGLALLFFLIARGLSSQPVNTQSSVDGYAAMAALVGMFSQQALAKLKQIAEGFFSAAEKGKDQAVSHATPKLVSVTPAQGTTSGKTTVIVTGTSMKGISQLLFGGVAATNMTVDSDTQITVDVPEHAAGKVDVDAVTTDGQRISLTGAFTYVQPPVPVDPSPINSETDRQVEAASRDGH
jgi:hypothetical protein